MKTKNFVQIAIFTMALMFAKAQTLIDAVHQLKNISPIVTVERSQCIGSGTGTITSGNPSSSVSESWNCQGFQLYQFTLLDGTVLGPYVAIPTTAAIASQAVWQTLPLNSPDPALPSPSVGAIVITPGAGSYVTSSQTVTLFSNTVGASINYTLDGSTPTSTHGMLYTGPLTLTASTTVNAVGFMSGLANSAVTSAVFNITLPTGSKVSKAEDER